MDDDDKAALIDRYGEACVAYEGYRIAESKKAMKKARKKLLAALESQPDLERVKREAGAAALREAAEFFANHWMNDNPARGYVVSDLHALAIQSERGE